jgi:aldehyde dehydrogenase (NAD+)
MFALLKHFNLDAKNLGAYAGTEALNMEEPVKVISSFSPVTGEEIATVKTAGVKTYEEIIRRAQAAQKEWQMVPAPQRGEFIRLLGEALRDNKDMLGSMVTLEMGKSKQEGDGEVQEMIDIADFAVGQSRMLYGKTMHSERPLHRMYEQWHPYGLTGIVTAFNFPVAVWAWNACMASICGNVCIWKPSLKTPLVSIATHSICQEVMRQTGYEDLFHLIIPSNHEVTEKMADDSRIPLVSFTGSTAVGKTISARVAGRLGRSILELGGNNAIIVDEDADLALAIPAVVFGAVGTAGQRCTTTRRVFVKRDQFDSFVEKLSLAYQQIKIGDPLQQENHMGPLIDEQAVETYESTIAMLKQQGATIVTGGKRLDQPGYYVEPTIVTGVENTWPIVQEETFAPILYVMPYDDFDDAIALQNGVKQGLSSAVFTSQMRRAEEFLSAKGSDCGIANVNIGTSGAEIGGAFGGEKDTGGGRESGSDAWKGYMRRQTTTINWSAELPLAQGIKFDLA